MSLPLPPYAQLSGFLPQNEHAALLEWILTNQPSFKSATIMSGDDPIVDPDKRVGLTSRNLGPHGPRLHARLLDALPELMSKTGLNGQAPISLELELAAHGDGAYYRRHVDLPIGAARKARTIGEDRVLSAVLYLHAEPKGFSGGELRLFRLGPAASSDDPSDYVELEPLQNSLVAFHSWVEHEVRPIRCASGDFRDYRFALNCWFRRKL